MRKSTCTGCKFFYRLGELRDRSFEDQRYRASQAALLPDGNVLMMTTPGIFNLGAEFGSTSVMPNPASLVNYPHSAPL